MLSLVWQKKEIDSDMDSQGLQLAVFPSKLSIVTEGRDPGQRDVLAVFNPALSVAPRSCLIST